MIKLRKSRIDEIPLFIEIEKLEDTSDFIIPYSAEKHREGMRKPNTIYLSIINEDTLSGFIILAIEDDSGSVEFRRIVVATKGNGIGQAAMLDMERYCKEVLKCCRIWLDVFEINKRGRYIYNKLGYRQFETGEYDGKVLLYFDKQI
ncbi:MAG: GNAT family N-acetyltransferase [Gammaproteobacteria bacterium]|nr:GNAT family N-acetyltransferase [Gammaproteobacteria bacterium]